PVHGGDVDRPAAPALHAHALGHLLQPDGVREHVPALDAHVVVRPVAAEHGTVGIVLQRGGAVRRHLALADPPHDHPLRHQIPAPLPVKSVISASSALCTTPSPIDAALPLICAAVWIEPPPSASENVTSALA